MCPQNYTMSQPKRTTVRMHFISKIFLLFLLQKLVKSYMFLIGMLVVCVRMRYKSII
jgi:hypothetical protein